MWLLRMDLSLLLGWPQLYRSFQSFGFLSAIIDFQFISVNFQFLLSSCILSDMWTKMLDANLNSNVKVPLCESLASQFRSGKVTEMTRAREYISVNDDGDNNRRTFQWVLFDWQVTWYLPRAYGKRNCQLSENNHRFATSVFFRDARLAII